MTTSLGPDVTTEPDGGEPAPVRRRDTSNPHVARQRALGVLFQADLRGVDAVGVLDAADADPSLRGVLADDEDGEVVVLEAFTRTLVSGVNRERAALDAVISQHARGWQISRMPVVDRTILRLATFELLHESTPHAVVIDEAVGFAKDLSTEDSSRYVNGVLEAIRRAYATES